MNGKRIFGAFTIGIALFFFWPVVVGGWQKVSALRVAVAEREQLLADRTRILANVETAYAEYQTTLTQADGQKFTAMVPVRRDTAEVLSAMQAIATESGVQLSEVRAVEAASLEGEQFKKLALVINLSGSYAGMRQFLTSLEAYVRLVDVGTVEVGVDEGNPSELRFAISANAYFIK